MNRSPLVFCLLGLSLLTGCSGGDTPDQACRPGQAVCFVYSEFVLTCRDDGSGWDPEPCAEGTICYQGSCQDLSCLPGSRLCQDGAVATCRDDGSGLSEPEPCPSETLCVDGECLERLCSAGQLRCTDGGDVERCARDETAWELFLDCAEGLSCLDGLCLPAPCTSGQAECGPSTLYVCTDDGVWQGSPCGEGQPCIFGRCVECLASETCDEGEECLEGACRATAPAVLTRALPPGTVAVDYHAELAAAGGRPPYAWALIDGALPAGLSLTESGAIGGAPAEAGEAIFTVSVRDARLQTAEQGLTLEVLQDGEVRIATRQLPPADHGMPYLAPLAATGGVAPLGWQLLAGSLPAGLNLGSAGFIVGVPEELGSFPITLRVLDASTPPAFDEREFELVVEVSPLEIIGDSSYDLLLLRVIILPVLVPFIPYATSLQARGGVAPYLWSESPAPEGLSWLITEWGLPAGLTLGEGGRVNGWVTDVSSAQTITIPFGPTLAGYFFFARVADSQSPADQDEAIFCIPTVPL